MLLVALDGFESCFEGFEQKGTFFFFFRNGSHAMVVSKKIL